jgi:hypothetical protein
MKMTKCPMQGNCGGTGWEYVPANDGPNPEPARYVRCACNPYGLGDPETPMVELRRRVPAYVDMDSDDAPF